MAKKWLPANSARSEPFFFILLAAFYLSLYFSGSNKALLLIFVAFGVLFYLHFRNLLLALFTLYLLFLPFAKGKSLSFVLIPGEMLRTNIPYTYDFSATFADVAAIGLGLLFIREELIPSLPKQKASPADFFLLIFLFFAFVSLFFSQFPEATFFAFLKLARVAFAFFLAKRMLYFPRAKKILVSILAASATFQGAWASLQFLLHHPLGRALEPLGKTFSPYGYFASEAKTFFRAQGTFDHPNTLGVFSTVLLIFLLAQWLNYRQSRGEKWLLAGGLLGGLLGLLFSASRASWLVFALVGLVIGLSWQRKRMARLLDRRLLLAMALIVLLALPLLVLPRLGQLYLTLTGKGGAYYRLYLLEKAWALGHQHPFGVGLATFPAVLIYKFGFFTWPSPVHNLWLEIFAELGIFGLASFLIFLLLAYKGFFQKIKMAQPKNIFYLRWGAFFASLAFLGVAEFYPFLWCSLIFEYFWLFLGIMVA